MQFAQYCNIKNKESLISSIGGLDRRYLFAPIGAVAALGLAGCGGSAELEVGQAYCYGVNYSKTKKDMEESSCGYGTPFVFTDTGHFVLLKMGRWHSYKGSQNIGVPFRPYRIEDGKFNPNGWTGIDDELFDLKSVGADDIRVKVGDGAPEDDNGSAIYLWFTKETSEAAQKQMELYKKMEEFEPAPLLVGDKTYLNTPLCLVETTYRSVSSKSRKSACDENNSVAFWHSDGMFITVDLDDYTDEDGYEWHYEASWNYNHSDAPAMPDPVRPDTGERIGPKRHWLINEQGFPYAYGMRSGDTTRYPVVEFEPYDGDQLERLKTAYADYIYPSMAKNALLLDN